MTILKELWTKEIENGEVKSTYQYITDLKDRIDYSMELAQTNLARASKRYAQLYNRKARSKNFKVGNQVLILLPKKSNKLLVHWRGPYPILERVGPLDYRIQMERKVKTFHANLLKLYVERTEEEKVVSIAFIDAESEDNELNSQQLCIDMSDSLSTKGEYHHSPA